MKDIDLKNGKVFYQHTKNKKLQTANISPQLVKSLTDYINMWRIEGVEEDDFLFCNISGEQLSKASLAQGYRQYTKSRGVNKTNIHGLRHTFAREWFLNGGDVVQLSKILGHSTLAMSEHYMNIYADMARDRFVQYNPLDNITRSGARKTVKRKD
jgi:integrase/recombinase XerD